jgi:hypothetical protein
LTAFKATSENIPNSPESLANYQSSKSRQLRSYRTPQPPTWRQHNIKILLRTAPPSCPDSPTDKNSDSEGNDAACHGPTNYYVPNIHNISNSVKPIPNRISCLRCHSTHLPFKGSNLEPQVCLCLVDLLSQL